MRLAPISIAEFTADAASHLLRRAVIGPRPSEVLQAREEGLERTIDRLFTPFEPEVQTIRHLVDNDIIAESIPNDSERGIGFFSEKNGRYKDFRQWWSRTIVTSPPSLQERLVLLWHMHFATSCNGAHFAEHCLDQNNAIRNNVFGQIPGIVQEVTLGFAMQAYLDGLSNSWSPQLDAVNENHARELLEIHLLGHVGRTTQALYTQAEIVATAHAFSGHHKSEYWVSHGDGTSSLYRKRTCLWSKDRWKPDPINLFGRFGVWTPPDVVPLLFETRTADISMWFARRLCTEFCAIESELLQGDVELVADLLIRNNFSLEPTLRVLLSSEMFFDPRYRMRLVRPPMNLLLGMMRTFNTLDVPDFYAEDTRGGDDLLLRLSRLGQLPYDPPNVSGWRRDLDWITASDATRRIDTCRRFGQGKLTYKDDVGSTIVMRYDALQVAYEFANPNDVDALSTSMCQILLGTTHPDIVSSVRLVMLGGMPIKKWNPSSGNKESIAGIRRGFTHILSAPRFQLF